MKRNFKKLAVTGLIVGCITVAGTGMAVMASGNAYENFKAAALQTMKQENMTTNSDFTLKQNGTVIMTGSSVTQKDGQTSYSTGTVTSDGKTIEIESMSDDNTIISRIDDQYMKMEADSDEDDRHGRRDNLDESPNTVKMMEMVTDVLVGDVKTHFTGDSNQISVNLEGAQIPELLNVSVAAMSEQSHLGSKRAERGELTKDMFDEIDVTELKNVSIKALGLDSDLENGYLANSTIRITIAGTDSAGKTQEYELTCKMELSNLGNTVPGTIDTAGKDVKEITAESLYR